MNPSSIAYMPFPRVPNEPMIPGRFSQPGFRPDFLSFRASTFSVVRSASIPVGHLDLGADRGKLPNSVLPVLPPTLAQTLKRAIG